MGRRQLRGKSIVLNQGGFSPGDNPSLVVWLNEADTSKMWQERGADTTPADGNGDLVGHIYNSVAGITEFRSFADASRPTISIPGVSGRNASLNFDESVTGDNLESLLGKTALKFIHGAACSFTIIFWVEMKASTDGTNQMLLSNNAASATLPGFMVWRRTDNSITFRAVSDGGIKSDHDTTATLTESDGLTRIEVTCSGVGAGLGSIRIGATEETFTTVAGVDEDSNDTLHIMSRNDTTLWNTDGHLSQLMILDAPIDADFRANYAAYNPAVI